MQAHSPSAVCVCSVAYWTPTLGFIIATGPDLRDLGMTVEKSDRPNGANAPSMTELSIFTHPCRLHQLGRRVGDSTGRF